MATESSQPHRQQQAGETNPVFPMFSQMLPLPISGSVRICRSKESANQSVGGEGRRRSLDRVSGEMGLGGREVRAEAVLFWRGF